MIVLDTNVVSEIWRPTPHEGVIAWLDAQPSDTTFLCTPVLAELRYGLELLHASARRERLRAQIDTIENEVFRDRILAFDAAAAVRFGVLASKRIRAGRRMETVDALIAAIALSHNAALATRDVEDFTGIGLHVIDPFAHSPAAD